MSLFPLIPPIDRRLLAGLCAGLLALFPAAALAAREAKTPLGAADLEASRLLDRARELLAAKETDRAVNMLDTIVQQYPTSPLRFAAHLELGKHYLADHQQLQAVNHFAQLRALEQPGESLAPADQELLLESLYLGGVAYFQVRQYGAAFPLLRKITNEYPNTVWANQAYYYIGLCHFAQKNWNKAIDALSLVGTFVDPDSPTLQYVEAGRRLYLKIADEDLPVLDRLGQAITATVQTTRGDKETVTTIPLGADGTVFIGSLPTEIGPGKAGDGRLQVIGGDTLTIEYLDRNTDDGTANVLRRQTATVVSTGALIPTLGDYETPAAAAFHDQPLFFRLQDADRDTSDNADTVAIRVVSRYRDEAGEQDKIAVEALTKGVDVAQALAQAEQERWQVRDEVRVTLVEQGAAPVHSGRFGGQVRVVAPVTDQPVDRADAVLTAALTDEIVATYEDARHIGGESLRMVETTLSVLGAIDNRPRATQDVVTDPVVKSRKNLVEATAFLELARIFRSMGLLDGARARAAEGLERVDFMVRTRSMLPTELREQAYKLKWELHLVTDDFQKALATCELFNRLFPNSPFVDQALLGVARIYAEQKDYARAIGVYQRILRLTQSQAKAEAQFRIAEALDLEAQAAAAAGRSAGGSERAIQEYKLCAERYPDSEFAGAALAKLVDYQIENKDYARAGELLQQIFQDYPDAAFLDGMLLKWVVVSYRAGDYQGAHDKASRLLFEYPQSSYAEKAKEVLPKIEAVLKKNQG